MAKKEQHPAQKYLDAAGVIIVAIDADQKVNLINKKGCEILGYKEGEIVGKNWFEHFIPERIREQVRDTFAKMTSWEIEAVEYFENPVVKKWRGEHCCVAQLGIDGSGRPNHWYSQFWRRYH